MGGRYHDVVVDIVVAAELADDGRRCHGICRGEQAKHLVRLINLRAVVGNLVQFVGTGGEGGGQAAADQSCRQKSIYILQLHHFTFLPFYFLPFYLYQKPNLSVAVNCLEMGDATPPALTNSGS